MVQLISIGWVLVATFIGSFGALMLKKSMENKEFKKLIFNRYLWLGLFLYGFSTIFYVLALRKEQLSVVYPFVSTSYLWTAFFSVKFLGEKMNKWKYISLVGIVLGIVMIGFGS